MQFPDGLKSLAKEISAKIEKETSSEVAIWLGSCFGACDLPQPERLEKLGFDVIIQWGHSEWPFEKEGKKEIIVLNK